MKKRSKGCFFMHDNVNMGLTNEKDSVLVGCGATENGGAVYLQSGSPAFTMEAGTIQSGTAFIHGCAALSNAVMYNDYIHASDLGRLMASYVWYSAITGKPVEDLPDTVPGVLPHNGLKSA